MDKKSVKQVLELFDQLDGHQVQDADNSNPLPSSVLREDTVQNKPDQAKLIVQNFPHQQDGFCSLPTVIG